MSSHDTGNGDEPATLDDLNSAFRALADPSRRRILDLLKEQPGQSVGELTAHFEFTRYAVMKHLSVLEDANLVVSRREGRRRLLFLNVMPLQQISKRWMTRFDIERASWLSMFKRMLEASPGPEHAMSDSKHPKQVYVLYIRTTPEALWDAITNPELTARYFYGTRIDSDFEVGAALRYMGEESAAIEGEVVEIEPRRKLVHSFAFPDQPDDAPTRVTWEIEPEGDVCKLTVIHEGFEGHTDTWDITSGGWPYILNSLKTFIETGEPLPPPESASNDDMEG